MYRVTLCLLLLIFTTRPCYCMQDCAHCCSLLLSCMHNVMNVYKFLPFPLFCLSLSLTHTHTVALQRKALLVKRYKELKESGQLDRVLRKRRKRNAAKERKRMLPRRSMT